MRRYIIILLFLLLYVPVFTQSFTISGTLVDEGTGEHLVSANVYNVADYIGTTSNFYGFYSIKLPYGKVTLIYSYVGYETKEITFQLTRDTVINVELAQNLTIEEVTITDKGPAATVRSAQMSLVEIPVIQAKQLPVLFGEVDIIKTIQLLPGVQSGTEGLSGLYVRGGGPSENLILLDGVPVYNVSHLFGFMSVFNADAINNFSLYKGGFPARYGGRLSSVLDVKMKEGNMKKFKGTGSIGLISSQLTLEGPIIKDRASFIFSARRSYIDVLTWPIQKAYSKAQGNDFDILAGYYLYDINAKVNYKYSDKSRFYLSMYTGKDKFYSKFKDKYEDYYSYYEDEMDMQFWWGNITSAFRWNYIISNNLFCNLTATYSRYRMQVSDEYNYKTVYYEDTTSYGSMFYFAYHSGIRDLAAKVDFDYIPSPNHYIRFGLDNIYHTFSPGVTVARMEDSSFEEEIDTTFGNKNIYANELAIYIEDEINISRHLKSNIGLRGTTFQVRSKTYYSVEPRLSMRYLINDKISVKAAFSTMQQYIHLLTNSSMSLPTDLWMPVTDSIRPMKSWQVAAGMAWNLNKGFEFTAEGYYKKLNDVIEYKEGASYYDFNGDWEDNIEMGQGETYGMELMLQRQEGNTKGWIAYTLAWANRQFDNISYGRIFPFKYDRRHDFAIAVTHTFKKRIDLGVTWIYGSGYPFTFGDQMFYSLLGLQNQSSYDETGYYNYYGSDRFLENIETRNNYRLPDYHRLDVGLTFHKVKENYTRLLGVGVYNVYSRNNPFFVYKDYKYVTDRNGNLLPPVKEMKQISIFPFLPYIKIGFDF